MNESEVLKQSVAVLRSEIKAYTLLRVFDGLVMPPLIYCESI